MQNIRKRSGIALGAILSLVVSLFAGVTPATAANEAAAVVTPLGSGALTANSVPITERFELYTRHGNTVAGVNAGDLGNGTAANYSLFYSISSESNGVNIYTAAGSAFAGASRVDTPTSVSAAADYPSSAATGYFTVTSTSPYVYFEMDQNVVNSLSAAVSITVTPFLDNDGEAGWSAGDSKGDAYTFRFIPWSGLGASLALSTPVQGYNGSTASVTLTEGTVRWSQLDGSFAVGFSNTQDVESDAVTLSAQATAATSPTTYGLSGSSIVSGNYSFSAAVQTSQMTTLGAVNSVSAILYYINTGSIDGSDPEAALAGAMALGATVTKAVTAVSAAGLTVSPVTSANIAKTGDNNADVRYNSAFTLNVFPYSASTTTSIAVASTFEVVSNTGLEFGANAGVRIAGTAYTTSAALNAVELTIAAGTTTLAMETFGQEADATDNIVVKLTSQLQSTTLTLQLKEVDLTVAYTPTTVAGLAGTTKSFPVTITDQWGSSTPRTDLRVKGTLVLTGGSTSTAVATVTAGAATLAIAPAPAINTGSATLTLQTEYYNQATQGWQSIGNSDSVAWNVYSYTAGTDAFKAPTTPSVSASISYGVTAYSWSGVMTVTVVNSYSPVTVTATGLVIQNSDVTTDTASDTLTIAANGQSANFKFAGHKAGTYTVTFTSGTATTTSLVVIDAAGHDKGASITFDTTNLVAGATTAITGTLVDKHGNPVATGGTASVAVVYTGKGLPFNNSSAMQTDANGEFTFQVLVLSTEKGDAAISATYKPAGATVSTANKTFAHALTVGGAAASADKKVNAGSFKGFVAVYARGYEGQRLSAKIGNDWVIVDPIVNNQENGTLFRVVDFTGAGVNIAVRIYIDRVLIDTINLTTK